MKVETGLLNIKSKHWLFSRTTDLVLLLFPVWALWGIIFWFSGSLNNMELPLWAWVIFILGVDVSHVWSTLFRSYADKEEFNAQKKLLIIAPIIVFVISISLLSISTQWFWRIMAYVAIFHFIKQQYGFTALYNYKTGNRRKTRLSDKLVIYVAALYPVVYWHFNSTSNFNWFIKADFFQLHSLFENQLVVQQVFGVLNYFYWCFIGLWLLQEIRAHLKGELVSIGKVLWVLTTALNWWFGIVYFNSDLIFSISNVVAHGIPYIVLIYFYRLKKEDVKSQIKMKSIWRFKWALMLVSVIFIIALIEEYLWDMFINRDHGSFFEYILPYEFEQLTTKPLILIAVAILALPQQVHYVIDGFIWKMNTKNKYLRSIFSTKHES
ncbi:MAG: hypothetical protein JKY54_13010 [Flavobacteriales bacterium]|nr:hypothetical protein [Flavobacteriales bacterium]